jgi:phage shock protein C
MNRITRNTNDSVMGGVCSGIGDYIGIDPLWIRLIFIGIFLAYGAGLLLYFILWLIIPDEDGDY